MARFPRPYPLVGPFGRCGALSAGISAFGHDVLESGGNRHLRSFLSSRQPWGSGSSISELRHTDQARTAVALERPRVDAGSISCPLGSILRHLRGAPGLLWPGLTCGSDRRVRPHPVSGLFVARRATAWTYPRRRLVGPARRWPRGAKGRRSGWRRLRPPLLQRALTWRVVHAVGSSCLRS